MFRHKAKLHGNNCREVPHNHKQTDRRKQLTRDQQKRQHNGPARKLRIRRVLLLLLSVLFYILPQAGTQQTMAKSQMA